MKQIAMQLDVEASLRVEIDEQTRKQLVSLMAAAICAVARGSLPLESRVLRERSDDDDPS